MGKWERFLTSISKSKQIFVVGPMASHDFRAMGPTIYVDGGADYRDDSGDGSISTISVGDNDSFAGKLEVVIPQKKSYSDLAYVLRDLPKSVRHIELIGFLGGRRDHELINYGVVHDFLKGRENFTTVRFDDMIVAFAGGHVNVTINGTFSVVMFEQSLVTITGSCDYTIPTPNIILPVSSEGLSNRGFGLVTIDSHKPCFVFIN